MSIEITNIACPKEWESENDFDSHRPALWLALQNTKGRVVELGMGYGSTLLLGKWCCLQDRWFASWDTNKEWYEKIAKAPKYIEGAMALSLCKDYLNHHVRKDIIRASLLFVDCAPAEIRRQIIWEYKDSPLVIVVHDTEPGAEYVYGLSGILSTFKYRIDYKPEGNPATTIVSDTIDITKWINQSSTSYLTADDKKNMNP